MVDLSARPLRSRLILRKERLHPGAQLTFADQEDTGSLRFITDAPIGAVPGQLAGPDLRHRQHALVEDRIREAKATGQRNLPCQSWSSSSACLKIMLTATDLIAWCKLIGFADEPNLARCEVAAFGYRVPHVATRPGRLSDRRQDHPRRQTKPGCARTGHPAEPLDRTAPAIKAIVPSPMAGRHSSLLSPRTG